MGMCCESALALAHDVFELVTRSEDQNQFNHKGVGTQQQPDPTQRPIEKVTVETAGMQ